MSVERFDVDDMSIHSLTGAYMTGSLSWEEYDSYEAHLESCEACQAEVDEMTAAAEALFTTVQAEVSPTLMNRILLAPDGIAILTDPSPEAPVPASGPAAAAPARTQKQSRNLKRMFALAAAFVVIVGGSIVLSQTRTQTPAEQVAAAQDVRAISLAETADGGAFQLELVASASSESVAFLDQSFPGIATDEAYALWRIPTGEGAAPEFLGLISSTDTQQAFSADVSNAAAFAVSIEEAGANPSAPSERVVFVGAVS